jgi:hypothetical protein
LHQLDSNKEFHCLITDPPFPRLSQREPDSTLLGDAPDEAGRPLRRDCGHFVSARELELPATS